AIRAESPDLVYSDEDRIEEDGRPTAPFFKPAWSPDLLQSLNYVGNLAVVRRNCVEALGMPSRPGAPEDEFFLSLAERNPRVTHIPQPLYSQRVLSPAARALYFDNPYEQRHEPQPKNLRGTLTAAPLVSIVI